MTLRLRLALGILAIAAVLLVPLALALASLERLDAVTERLHNRDLAASLFLNRMRGLTADLANAENAVVIISDTASRNWMARDIASLVAQADSLDQFDLDSIAPRIQQAAATVARLAPLEYAAVEAGNTRTVDSLSTRHVRPAIAQMNRWVELAGSELNARTGFSVQEAQEETARAQQIAAASLAIAALLALLIGIWLTRSIDRPVRDLQHGMEAVADGDFTYKLAVPSTRRDEFGRLAESFQVMSRQLAELEKLRAEFISIASHELKTPINVIVGYVQLLQEDVYGALSQKQREVCGTLDKQAQSLARLVRQLLDVSRFRAGAGKLEPRRLELAKFLEDLESAFRVLALQRGIRFRVAASEGVPAEVFWDPDRMNEVLGNLLANAFKFTERGGTVELTVDAERDTVHMEVHDTGAGIPAAQLPHIFEKFYQADNQAQASAKGTGLGLAIAKEIVEAHRGTITVESTPGVGTTFSIQLPARVAITRRTSASRAVSVVQA